MDYLLLSRATVSGLTLDLASSERVIKAKDSTAVLHSAALLDEMRRRERDHTQVCEQALAEARLQGLDEGRSQAREEVAQQLAELAAARQAALASLAPTLTDIVMEAVAAVARGVDKKVLFESAMTAVQGLVRQARWARLRVHPSAADAAAAALDGAGAVWQIATVVADEELEPDACVLETDVCSADASLSVQLQALRSAVADSMQSTLAAIPAPEQAGSE